MKNLKFIILLLLTPFICLAVYETNEPTAIGPDQRICTEIVTPATICIKGFDSIGDNVMIKEANSTFNCSINVLNDKCFMYTPLPGLVNVADTIVVKACNNDEPVLCDELTVLVDVEEDCGSYMLANNDFFNIKLESENSFNVLSNDEIDENETYDISIILEEENPYINITANSPYINVEIDKDGLNNEFLNGDLNEDVLVWYPDENSSHGGTNNYNYSFKYALCDGNLNCDISNVTLSIVVEIALSNEDNIETFDFELYPNPVDDFLFISTAQLIQGIQIYDPTSKMLSNKILNQKTNLLSEDVSFLQNGLYFISLQLENDQQIIQKIYKQ